MYHVKVDLGVILYFDIQKKLVLENAYMFFLLLLDVL